MNQAAIEKLVRDFANLNVLVVGDVMIDAYLWGKTERISPEAPVPIVSIEKEESRLGGAANVALNLKAFGANPIICAVIGADEKGKSFGGLLEAKALPTAGLVASEYRPTTVKTRIISSNQQMLRVDQEVTTWLNANEEAQVLGRIKQVLDTQKIDVIVLEDYNKGLLTTKVIEGIIAEANARNIPTAVDPKKDNFFAYKGVTLFKPNLKELKEGLKVDFDHTNLDELGKAVDLLQDRLTPQYAFITLSEHGVYIQSKASKDHVPAHIRNISDVSGAGDTVISVASLCLALNVPPKALAALANLAGGLVCERVGVVPIDQEQFLAEALLIADTL